MAWSRFTPRVFFVLGTIVSSTLPTMASGGLVFTAEEVGSNVILTGTGSINTSTLTGASSITTRNYSGFVSLSAINSGTGSSGAPVPLSSNFWSAVRTSGTDQVALGTITAQSTSGNPVIFGGGNNQNTLALPVTYTSGSPLFTTMTFNSKTFSDFGWEFPMNRTWTLNNGETVSLVTVPEPATYAMALAGIACGGFSMWRRRKRARAGLFGLTTRTLWAFAALFSIMVQQAANADVFLWSSPVAISGDADVVTEGTLLYAFNMGSTGVAASTVNGVTFAAWPLPSGGANSNTSPNGSAVYRTTITASLYAYNNLGTGAGPFAGLSADYQTLLGSGGSANQQTINLTFNGLEIGQQYLYQFWTNNSAQISNIRPMIDTTTKLTADVVGVTLDANVGNTSGNLGQFATGTFTATSTSIGLSNQSSVGNAPLINAFQIRAVPEPAAYAMALAGIACGGFSMWRRRKRT